QLLQVNEQTTDGTTPLLQLASASEFSDDHLRTAQLLIDSGASLFLANTNGITPLYAACRAKRGFVFCEYLIKQGAAIDTVTGTQRTLLFAALEGGDTAIIDLILSHGLRADVADSAGMTPLM